MSGSEHMNIFYIHVYNVLYYTGYVLGKISKHAEMWCSGRKST